jgi:predicted RND superfamily exporter protein
MVTRRPWCTIAAVLALTALALSRIVDFTARPPALRVHVDASVERLLVGDESRPFYERMRLLFGSDDVLVVAVASDDLFAPATLHRVRSMERRIRRLDGVERVASLFSALDVRAEDGNLVILPFLEGVPEDAELLSEIRDRVLANPVYAGKLVSRDARVTALLVYLEEMTELEFMDAGLDAAIRTVVEEERGNTEVWISGERYMRAATSRLALADLARILPLSAGLLTLVAFASFRTLRGVLVPLATVGIANLWTVGTLAALGDSLNLLTLLVPPLVQTVGFAYVIYVVSEYYDQLRDQGAAAPAGGLGPAGEAVSQNGLALLLAVFTTVVGLIASSLSPISAVRQFGAFSLLGVVYAGVLAVTFAPALLCLGTQRAPASRRSSGGIEALAERVGRFDFRHRRAIVGVAIVVFAISLVGLTRVRVRMDIVSNLPPEHPVRRDFTAIIHSLDGAGGVSVAVQSEARDAFKEPSNLRELESLQRWLEEQPEVGGTTSLADFVRVLHRSVSGDPQAASIPDSRGLIAQMLFFGGSPEMSRFVSSSYNATQIAVGVRTVDSGELGRLVARVGDRLARLPAELDGQITGGQVLVSRTVNAISGAQGQSLALAFVVIYAALALVFRSWRVGLLALVPNALPIAFYFGVLGWSGISLNLVTGLVACLALGIAVDDTIHFFMRFRAQRPLHASAGEAAVASLRAVARPVTVTSTALCLSFLALTSAELRDPAQFGALSAATLGFAWLSDVFLTPVLAAASVPEHGGSRGAG